MPCITKFCVKQRCLNPIAIVEEDGSGMVRVLPINVHVHVHVLPISVPSKVYESLVKTHSGKVNSCCMIHAYDCILLVV